MRKLLICPYFGELPSWMDKWQERVEARLVPAGYTILLDTDEARFRQRVKDRLEIECPPMAGTGKIWDYRPTFGVLYEEEIAQTKAGYWGHTDFDVVFGNVEHFWPDELIDESDLISDHPYYVCGPWTLYRFGSGVSRLFEWAGNWREILEDPTPSGWIETAYTEMLHGSQFRYNLTLHHAYLDPSNLCIEADGRLMHGSREIPFFHFRRTKEWPL